MSNDVDTYQTLSEEVSGKIRDIKDFPKPGIIFKDMTPVLQDGKLFSAIIDAWTKRYTDKNIDVIVGIESRGFIFGAPLAANLGISFVPVRKPGKLPFKTTGIDYDLEYGTDRLEIHTDALKKGDRVLIVDDLLATGGTCGATIKLVKSLGAAVVESLFLIELDFLEGQKLLDSDVHAMVHYT